jgi:hypothetical protein
MTVSGACLHTLYVSTLLILAPQKNLVLLMTITNEDDSTSIKPVTAPPAAAKCSSEDVKLIEELKAELGLHIQVLAV